MSFGSNCNGYCNFPRFRRITNIAFIFKLLQIANFNTNFTNYKKYSFGNTHSSIAANCENIKCSVATEASPSLLVYLELRFVHLLGSITRRLLVLQLSIRNSKLISVGNFTTMLNPISSI